jgi:hypothetical protein
MAVPYAFSWLVLNKVDLTIMMGRNRNINRSYIMHTFKEIEVYCFAFACLTVGRIVRLSVDQMVSAQ